MIIGKINIGDAPIMDKITLGLKIRQLREQRNLTQMEFAEMIDITDKALSKIEVGRNYPHLNTLMAISEKLGVSLGFLVSENKTIGKEIYVNEINERVSKMSLHSVKHILEYIELYSKTERERQENIEE